MTLFSIADLDTSERVAAVLVIASGAHLLVLAVRHYAKHLLSVEALRRWSKLRTLAGLITSALVFVLYFAALGLVLQEFGVSLTAYLASASIIGLAIGFGSQGVVQDVVTGLTVILSDLFQVGDLVEISGQTGVVQNISMRFTSLLNPMGASVYIPNRTLTNVIIYPRGYVRCFADVTLSSEQSLAEQMLASIENITSGFVQQFPGILRDQVEICPVEVTASGRQFVRIKFRIWPGRSATVEQAYRNEILASMKLLDPDYADWMLAINNEVSETPSAIKPIRFGYRRKTGVGEGNGRSGR